MYTVRRHESSISVNEYIEGYVNVEEFLECCKVCPNYGNVWSCPPFEFDVLDYWKQYDIFDVYAEEIIFDDEFAGKNFEKEEINSIIKDSIMQVKLNLTEELYEKEKLYPGSVSLSAGSCTICGDECARKKADKCRYPEKIRYSIESLGGNVGLTISKLMGIEIEWISEGVLPEKFVLVCGILRKKSE